jgi:hypothetical protein
MPGFRVERKKEIRDRFFQVELVQLMMVWVKVTPQR